MCGSDQTTLAVFLYVSSRFASVLSVHCKGWLNSSQAGWPHDHCTFTTDVIRHPELQMAGLCSALFKYR